MKTKFKKKASRKKLMAVHGDGVLKIIITASSAVFALPLRITLFYLRNLNHVANHINILKVIPMKQIY